MLTKSKSNMTLDGGFELPLVKFRKSTTSRLRKSASKKVLKSSKSQDVIRNLNII